MKTPATARKPRCEKTPLKALTLGILRSMSMLSLLIITLLMGMAHVRPASAVESPPNYVLTYLGSGSPAAINNHGTVVGARVNGSYYEPLVSTNGSPWTPLPVPTGAQSVFPTGVNDNDVIVGVSYTNWVATAVRWKPVGGGSYTVEVLPFLPGSSSSYATAINNLGQIVGSRSAMGYTPQGTGWLYSDTLGLVDLYASYGLAVIPTAINDTGKILAGIELLDLTTRTISVIGGGPTNYNPVTAVAINNSGMMAGYAALRSSSLNIVSVFFNDGINGWNYIAGSTKYTTASSINSRGDIGYGEQGAGIFLNGLGVYALNSLLDISSTSAGWAISGNGVKINDQRLVATLGRNSLTGQAGGVLLTPAGTVVPPPPQPSQSPLLTATPTSGTAPLTVTFASSAASDQNGPLISSYAVDYGDDSGSLFVVNFGEGVPSFSGNSSHTYTAAGTYTATLTVNYINAISGSAMATITVNPVVITPTLRSTAINLSATLQRNKVSATGNVVVTNNSGAAVSGAVVSATWARPGGGTVTQTATTNSAGTARFTTSGTRGTYTLKVNSISKTGFSFDSANSVLSKSITR